SKVNGGAYVTGHHKYSADIKLPGMLHGRVLRPPAVGATLKSLDSHEAEAMPGVTVVRDGDFAGVAAGNEQEAERAVAALRAEWTRTDQPSDGQLFEYLKSNAGDPQIVHSSGSIGEALGAADFKLNQTYTIAYIAHAPLEPRAAVAEWKGDK